MCGIVGVIFQQGDVDRCLSQAQKVQNHRGPDANGVWKTKVGPWHLGLGHQRLSIHDLSTAGTQPMSGPGDLGWIVYNGEVYNFIEIRAELESLGWSFQSKTDTEVVLIALNEWGIDAINKFNGMWAFCWFDIKNQRLVFSRDRMGKKPFYYFLEEDRLFFSSEIKAILVMTEQKFSVNEQLVGEFLYQSLLDTSSQTFFKNIYKLPAGHFAICDLAPPDKLTLNIQPYWKLNPTYETPATDSEELAAEVRELFLDSVRIRLRSDVPVGILLSGGVDSSAIASAVHHLLGPTVPLNLLSAVSNDQRFDESPFIDRMTQYLGCQAHKVVVDSQPNQLFDLLGKVIWHQDEPIGSFSAVAHYLLMETADHLGITVILSGQGADEPLCGYKKYLGFYLLSLMKQGQIPTALATFWKFFRQGTVLQQFKIQEAKRYLPHFFQPKDLDIGGVSLKETYQPIFISVGASVSVRERQIWDLLKFSVPILTHEEDRDSMAFAKEVRLPFLDYRFLEKFIALPDQLKLHNGWTKYIFRQAMAPLLPKEIVWRKDKQGFTIPQEQWLKSSFRPRIEALFAEDCLMYQKKLVDREALQQKYQLFCQQKVGKGTISYKDILHPLNLEVWLRTFEASLL
ncbi:MAG: asparagine synthase (glutamine-hydrolyzing) [Magnetococcus sp. DMHC-6]